MSDRNLTEDVVRQEAQQQIGDLRSLLVRLEDGERLGHLQQFLNSNGGENRAFPGGVLLEWRWSVLRRPQHDVELSDEDIDSIIGLTVVLLWADDVAIDAYADPRRRKISTAVAG